MTAPFSTTRNPFLSVFQSAAQGFARQRSPAGVEPANHPMAQSAAHVARLRQDPRRAYAPPMGVPPISLTCAGLGLELLEAIVARDEQRQRLLHNRIDFSQCDPLWAETLVAYAKNFGLDGKPRPIPYIRYADLTDFIITVPSPAMRVALLSDWGTGTDEARQVASLLAKQKPDAVIHLGDIYFSGTPEECRTHFLEPLRAVLPTQRLFTLCGNHDVYSGGAGYYALLQQLEQPASYFCLRSPDQSWQILAGDTGLNDRDPFDAATVLTRFDPAEEAWHRDKIAGFPGQTLFLTHHQPFSAFAQIGSLAQHDPVNPNLMASYARLAQAGHVDAWFWGHEHSLRVYQPYRGLARGRNIGYGAIPVAAVPNPQTPLASLLDPPQARSGVELDVIEGAYTHGFAMLDFTPGHIEASYWALTRPSGPIYREVIARDLV